MINSHIKSSFIFTRTETKFPVSTTARIIVRFDSVKVVIPWHFNSKFGISRFRRHGQTPRLGAPSEQATADLPTSINLHSIMKDRCSSCYYKKHISSNGTFQPERGFCRSERFCPKANVCHFDERFGTSHSPGSVLSIIIIIALNIRKITIKELV